MKKLILSISVCLSVLQANSTLHTIVTDGLHFVPNRLAVHVGDTVAFDLGPAFTATEVSATTWAANGNAPLVAQGAFDLEGPGLGMVIMTHEGYRYFVSKWHNTTGMKGMIQVIGPAGVPEQEPELLVNVFPNPTQDNLYLNIMGNDHIPVIMEIYDAAGNKVLDLGGKQVLSFGVKHVDVSVLPAGLYFLQITFVEVKKTRTLRFLKQ